MSAWSALALGPLVLIITACVAAVYTIAPFLFNETPNGLMRDL